MISETDRNYSVK